MPIVPFAPRNTSLEPTVPTPGRVNPIFLMAATAELHEAGRLMEVADKPMDIKSQAQKADLQKTANDWPEGSDPGVVKIFKDRLKAGDISREQYNKAMRDPRQFMEND